MVDWVGVCLDEVGIGYLNESRIALVIWVRLFLPVGMDTHPDSVVHVLDLLVGLQLLSHSGIFSLESLDVR